MTSITGSSTKTLFPDYERLKVSGRSSVPATMRIYLSSEMPTRSCHSRPRTLALASADALSTMDWDRSTIHPSERWLRNCWRAAGKRSTPGAIYTGSDSGPTRPAMGAAQRLPASGICIGWDRNGQRAGSRRPSVTLLYRTSSRRRRWTSPRALAGLSSRSYQALPETPQSVVLHTKTRSSTGVRVDVCLFGSLENTADYIGGNDRPPAGWSSSAAQAIDQYVYSRGTITTRSGTTRSRSRSKH